MRQNALSFKEGSHLPISSVNGLGHHRGCNLKIAFTIYHFLTCFSLLLALILPNIPSS